MMVLCKGTKLVFPAGVPESFNDDVRVVGDLVVPCIHHVEPGIGFFGDLFSIEGVFRVQHPPPDLRKVDVGHSAR